jgi:hypothetical protein
MKIYLVLLVMLTGCAMAPDRAGERERYIAAHNPSSVVAEALMEGRVVLGMSREAVKLVWGSPHSWSSYFEGQMEFWHYQQVCNVPGIFRPGPILQFRDGRVVSISHRSW